MFEVAEVTADLIDGPHVGADLNERGETVLVSLFGAARGLVIRFELRRDGELIRSRNEPIVVLHATEADAEPEAVTAEINRWIEKLYG